MIKPHQYVYNVEYRKPVPEFDFVCDRPMDGSDRLVKTSITAENEAHARQLIKETIGNVQVIKIWIF